MKIEIGKYVVVLALFLSMTMIEIGAADLVILHTNDTHSQIDPDDKDRGGALRRKALIDSVRAVERNVLLVDAGDAVQGTLYYTLYKGELEQRLLNEMGYDIQIMGNHEFDNGVDVLAKNYRKACSVILSTNYDFRATALNGLVRPYTIREYDGRRIGVIAINLNPKGMIADNNIVGVSHLDEVRAANSMAWYLKNVERVDMVIAMSHIGYDIDGVVSDVDVIKASHDIDIVIGGHSHTELGANVVDSPAYLLPDADGDSVLVAQTGKAGRYLGEIKINLDDMSASSRLIPINKRLDNRIDPELKELIKPYRAGVDSLMSVKIGHSSIELEQGSVALLNMVSDFVYNEGRRVVNGEVDMAIMNKGGIRQGIPKGDITKGMIMSMLPFENKVYVIDIKGSDLAEALDVMARRDGDGVSRGVDIVFDADTDHCIRIEINGKVLDPEQIYRVATIDYLANGGDYMESLTRGKVVAMSENRLDIDLINQFETGILKGKKLNPSMKMRMHP